MPPMKHALVLALAAASLVATSALAGPPAKRPACPVVKAPARDAKRQIPCRRQTIPPILDPTPMYLIATQAAPAAVSDLS